MIGQGTPLIPCIPHGGGRKSTGAVQGPYNIGHWLNYEIEQG